MKKLLLLSLALFTFNTYSQIKKIEGVWKSDKSAYLVAIFHQDNKFIFQNIGEDKLKEVVVNKGDDFIVTTLTNLDNNHEVVIKYTLLKNGKLRADFAGDYEGVVVHERYN